MRRLLMPGLLLALVVGCDTGTPEPTLYAPDDLASVLPQQVGDLTLQVEGSGGSEYLTETLGDAFLEGVLKTGFGIGIGYDPDAVRFALASSSTDSDEPRLMVFAVRVDGVPAGDLGLPPFDPRWEGPPDMEPWGSDYEWLLPDHRIGEVMFGAVATSDGLGVTSEDWIATLPTCQRKGKENLEPCRAPS
jgi:hypothetical protein